jgi:myosin-1
LPSESLQTFIGDVVVSMNPYKQMSIYGQDRIDAYRGESMYDLPPYM